MSKRNKKARHLQQRREVSQQRRATYREGVQTRTGVGWQSNQLSYRGGTLTERYTMASMRDRGRTAYRDNPIAKALVDIESENIAPSFTLHARTDSPAFNAEAEDRWEAFIEQADITGRWPGNSFFQFLWRVFRVDGDGAVVLVDRLGQSKLQYVPADWIGGSLGLYQPGIIDGVQVDGTDAPIAIHVRAYDETGRNATAIPLRVAEPGRQAIFVAFNDPGVPLAVRGLTCFNPCFALLDSLDGLVDATVTAARLQAAVGLVFRDDNPQKVLQGLAALQPGPNSQGRDEAVITIENGSIKVVGGNGEVSGVNATQPVPQMPEFIRTLNRIIGNAFGMPLEIASRDLSQVNFSGGRIGLLSYFRRCRAQQTWFIQKLLTPIYRWWLSREVNRGRFRSPVPRDYWDHKFSGREWDFTDPVTEMQAIQLQLDAGLIDDFEAAAHFGRDLETVYFGRQRARALRQKYGEPDPVRANTTRDTTLKTTLIDADGNPVGANQPLNGAQVAAANDILSRLTERTVVPTAATALLAGVGIPQLTAEKMVADTVSRQGVSPGDKQYAQAWSLKMMDVQGMKQIAGNKTDVNAVFTIAGLPLRAGDSQSYTPYLPVIGEEGPLVTGAIFYGPNGEFVGGDRNDKPDATEADLPNLSHSAAPASAIQE